MFWKNKDKDKKDKKDKKDVEVTVVKIDKPVSQSNLGMQPPPPSEDLKQQFTQLLYELGVPDAKRQEMETWSNDKKWMLLIQNKDKIKDNEEKMKQKGSLYETPQFYLSLLRENATTQKSIQDLRVCLASNTMSWINNFLALGGFNELLKILQTVQLKPEKNNDDFQIMTDCVGCIKSLLNSQAGIKAVMTTSHTFKLLALCLDLGYPVEFRNLILQLLAALTLVPQVGHQYVMEAMENLKVHSREKVRFWSVVEGARAVQKSKHTIMYEYLTSLMLFVNSVVNSPDDLQVRISLRAEFTTLQILELLKPCKGVFDDLDTQINVFNECSEEDHSVIDSQFTDVNIRSPAQVSEKLEEMLAQHPSLHHHFLSIIRSLYTLASTQSDLGGSRIWNNLDEAIGHILKDPTKESTMENLRAENSRLRNELEAFTKISKFSVDTSSAVTTSPPLTSSSASTVSNQAIEEIEHKLQQSNNEKLELSQKLKSIESELKNLTNTNSGLQLKVTKLESEILTLQNTTPSTTTTTTETTAVEVTSGGPPPPPPPPPPGPPPPPPPSGGPPPPPPPPGSGPPPPPPPPGGKKAVAAVPNLPPKKTVVPSVKMVGFQWKKIQNQQIESSMWMNVKDYNLGDQYKQLEELFQAKKPTAATNATAVGGPTSPTAGGLGMSAKSPGGLGTSASASSQTNTILDIKRSQAISIMLSRFKMSFSDLSKAISNLDDTKISLEDAKSLLKFVPTPEEIEILKDEDITQYGKPEQFLWELSKVSRITEKLECFIFKQKLSSQIEELTPDINSLLKASQEVKNNKSFHKILEIVLSLGNFINGGTNRGDLYGFKLDSLNALVDMRSTADSKVTLMNWLITFLETKHAEILQFPEQLTAIDEAKRVSIPNLKSEVASLKKGINQLTQESNQSDGVAKQILTTFVGKSQDLVNTVEKQFTQALESFNEMISYYGEDVKTATPEDFFAQISKFRNEFKKTYDNIQKDRENQAKAAARKKSVSPGPTGTPQSGGKPLPSGAKPLPGLGAKPPTPTIVTTTPTSNSHEDSSEDEQPNGQFMDSLMNSLRGGEAFKLSRRASQYVSLQPQKGALDALSSALKNKK
ncbi:actin binding protein [Tieghemostelium lacteum]|uniref:Actin binding protein n=1 Tax=Tieghemostelium lacteum TaxID=361077 RepID=A0A152A945_TIELA|nr:actin binding protein [Tieghemostelium lacteum]|eukprot:KYR02587.1 actin binding protein [Tieghemostelium lacteum]